MLNLLSISMEKIDILFAALVVSVVIFAINIIFINLRLKIINDIIDIQTDIINSLVECCDRSARMHINQTKINEAQNKFNDKIVNALIDTSSTGGRRSEAEAQS